MVAENRVGFARRAFRSCRICGYGLRIDAGILLHPLAYGFTQRLEVIAAFQQADNAALCINSGVKQAGFHRYRHLRVMTATSWFSSDRLEVDVSKLGQGYEEEKSRKNWQGYLIERRV